ASFDGAYSMNVSMNIGDKAAFYKEIIRILKTGAWLILSEIAKGPGGELDFPTPWARTAESSFLATPEATRQGLEAAGFAAINIRDTISESEDFAARSREMVERGLKPPHRAVRLVHGEMAADASANSARGLKNGCTIPIEAMCVKP
ncbi:MAG: class I SAM-dependent methyltransferase, partial [Geminicoccaceae bacterium]